MIAATGHSLLLADSNELNHLPKNNLCVHESFKGTGWFVGLSVYSSSSAMEGKRKVSAGKSLHRRMTVQVQAPYAGPAYH